MTTIALTPEAEAFLARVREELADLPPDERDELLEDIESHLAEITGEGDAPLAVRLGSAEDFAHELRHSAGLPPRSAPGEPSRLDLARTRATVIGRRAAALPRRLDATVFWRLARGWLLAVAVAVVVGRLGDTRAWSLSHPWLPHAGLRGRAAFIALAAFVVLSFWLARRAAGNGVRIDRAASAVAIVALAPALLHFNSPPRDHIYSYRTVVETQTEPGLVYNGVPLSNIFPFDRAGKPLNDVLLYGSDGQPLTVATQVADPSRRYLVTRRGERLYNSFPVRYFDPGTQRVARPDAGPRVKIPDILTPPLTTQKP
jgi:hypothetical protein